MNSARPFLVSAGALNYFASLFAYGNVEAVLANIDAYSAHEILLAWVLVSQPISRGPTIPLVALSSEVCKAPRARDCG
jgi:hypothetical protein